MYYECGDGWLSLIKQAIEIVNEYNEKHTKINDQITITNIKEDNGCLSIEFKPYITEIAFKFYELENYSKKDLDRYLWLVGKEYFKRNYK